MRLGTLDIVPEPVSLMLRQFPKQPLDGTVAPPCAWFRLQPLSWVAVVSQAPDSALAAGGAQSPAPARLPACPFSLSTNAVLASPAMKEDWGIGIVSLCPRSFPSNS